MFQEIKNGLRRQLADNYGSVRGFILYYKYRILALLGRFRRYKKIEWKLVDRLVFVCKGNICRSPYAEAIARSMNINTVSCGLDTHNGKPAYENAIVNASKRGIDLSIHKTKQLASVSIGKHDLIIVMEPMQAKQIEQQLGAGVNCTVLGLWNNPGSPYLHDPYGASDRYFSVCYSAIEKSVKNLAMNMR